MSETITTTNVKFDVFLTMAEFKKAIGADEISIKKSEKSGKIFAVAMGKTYKVKQEIDFNKDLRFAYLIDEGFDSGCIIHIESSAVEIKIL